jgi:hypothetical protein
VAGCATTPHHAEQVPDPAEAHRAKPLIIDDGEDLRGTLRVGDRHWPVLHAEIDADGLGFMFTGGVLVVPFERGDPDCDLIIEMTDRTLWSGVADPPQESDESLVIRGQVRTAAVEGDQPLELRVPRAMFGAGSSRITVASGYAFLTGEIGTRTYRQIQTLIEAHPDVRALVLVYVPGSVNDALSMKAGRLIRQAGFTTIVPAKSVIASGGVDLFIAGSTRIIEPGGVVGVHSWSEPLKGTDASELPRDDPAHDAAITYCREMLGDKGEAFYFFTLQAAPFDTMHWMTEDEIEQWGLRTQ